MDRSYHFGRMGRMGRLAVGTFLACCTALGFSACMHRGSESQLKEDVDSFAVHYYNWHFEKAAAYCTPESEKWLRFAATNVRPADIDSLRAKAVDAEVEVNDVNFDDNDSTALAILHVKDFLQMDSIGQAARPHKEATFRIPLVFRGEKWLVNLKSLPRAEK